MHPEPPTDPLAPTRRGLVILGAALATLTVAVLGAVVVGLVARIAATSPSPSMAVPSMVAVAPPGIVAPDDLPESVAGHYRAAEEHGHVFAEVPCFCGCEEMLGHRHLRDCFLRPDGSGWEAHGPGCGVCLGEADQVEEMVAEGGDVAAVRAAVIARWGDPYGAG